MILTTKQIYKLFIHRTDIYAEQQVSGSYYIIKEPITLIDIEQHLKGDKTLGTYVLNTDNTVKWACIDLDGKQLRTLYPSATIIYNSFKDFPRILEFSGRKGYHIWIFFRCRVTADYAQKLVKARLNRISLNYFEVFPKQTELNENRKYGNLVKIPLGTHKVSGKKSTIMKHDKLNEVL